MIIEVLTQITNRNVDKCFNYLVPSNFEDKIKIGIRVLIPFGNQVLEGFVIKIIDHENDIHDFKMKEIIDVIDEDAILTKELMEMGKFLQQKTLAPLITCYQAMLPKALKAKNKEKVKIKYVKVITMGNSCLDKYKDKQLEIIKLVKDNKEVLKKDLMNISLSSLNTLLKYDVLKEIEREVYRLSDEVVKLDKKVLNDEQTKVIEVVLENKNSFVPYLLYGVTGSGKTEVYMEIVDNIIRDNKTAIILVPEISLTPQIIKRFKSRFNEEIAILHSKLSDGEKYDEYRKILRSEVKIVIGARSAIFAPLKNLGIVIIDEEHSSSYHQESNPRYSVKDVALYLGEKNKIPVIFASATPTLESFARAKKDVYKLLTIKNRANNMSLPKIEIIDLNESKKKNLYFSEELINEIKNKLSKNEQIMLFLNKRGYSSYINCRNCGYVEKCPHCEISLTYHKNNNILRCHYCGYATKLNNKCPSCKEDALSNLGYGTEKIEEELKTMFTDAKIIRMDYDTTSKKGAHEKIIRAFEDHEYDILIGTQMIVKGLDFKDVTLVGVINADISLNIPDFRSSETTFQLLNQVAGRSGRSDKEGMVIIQTHNPEHYAIEYAKNHDYLSFYEQEMKIRKSLSYPPFYYVSLIKISSLDFEMLKVESNKIKKSLDNNLNSSIILGPTTSNLYKINNVFYMQIIVKYKKEENLFKISNNILEYYKTKNKIKVDIDFDPVSF